MTREEVIAAVKKAAEESGEVPTLEWLLKHAYVTKHAIRRHFGHFREALGACRLKHHRQGYQLPNRELLADWAAVVRQLGKIPSVIDYQSHGRYSIQPLTRRFGGWPYVPAGLMECARKEGLEEEWKDVMEIVTNHLHQAGADGRIIKGSTGLPFQPRILKDEPIYGPPMAESYLVMAPTNEQGVIFLFWSGGKEAGIRDAEDTDRVSGWRGVPGSCSGTVAADQI